MSKEKIPAELDFERDDRREGRIGDPIPDKEIREEFPGQRVREAGMTGGETPDGETTADDLTPETLLDSEPSRLGRNPADQSMRVVDAAAIGAGNGLDEAEMAECSPVGQEAAEATRRKARAHAADPSMAEPHEARELADAQRSRSASKKKKKPA